MIWLLAALAGGVGAVIRAVAARFENGITTVNLAGTALLVLVLRSSLSAGATFVVGVGLLGGLTTFSTWMIQILEQATVDPRAALVQSAQVSVLAVVIAAVALL